MKNSSFKANIPIRNRKFLSIEKNLNVEPILILLCQWHGTRFEIFMMKMEFDELRWYGEAKRKYFLINLCRGTHALRLKETNASRCQQSKKFLFSCSTFHFHPLFSPLDFIHHVQCEFMAKVS